ncbi:DNA phosphorothioation-dependent restriction protein DptH [Pseudaeromonas paramecii]|uniref:Helicase HerA central domain-containing protein n=1 Tax=Pseudaeromonas paramecii TaxID=2138166 RepID=A0ABP8PXC3_9GAMM
MSAKPYEQFLAEQCIDWIGQDIQAGTRYQFKSPDAENAKRLYQAFVTLSGGQTLSLGHMALPKVMCNGIALLPVLHGDAPEGCTENYISHLRDAVASRSGDLAQAGLLIIHNSMLDTLINSASDLAAPGAIWHPHTLQSKLAGLIDPYNDMRELSQCLLQDQLAIVTEEGATVFGFASLYRSLEDGRLEFSELGLFDDPLIRQMSGQSAQIRRRLDANRTLRRHIEFCVEHYADQLESQLKEFSPKFIQQHFLKESADWKQLAFQIYLDEMDANKAQKLILDAIELGAGMAGATLLQRDKSQTKAGQKEKSLLIALPAEVDTLALTLTFTGNDLESDQLRLMHNKGLDKVLHKQVRRGGGKRCWADLTLPFNGEPTFFSLELKRENRSEDYKLRCLLLREGDFYLEPLQNCFRVEPHKGWLTLLMDEDLLRLRAEPGPCLHLGADEEEVDCRGYGEVDFSEQANQIERIQFTLCSGESRLPINIEGPAAEEGLMLPLLFDKERFGRLLRDDYNGEYNRAKNKIVLDNAEHAVVGVRQQLLTLEARFVDERLIYIGSCGDPVRLGSLQASHPALHDAYAALFDYLARHKSLPSLVSWGEGYCRLVEAVVAAYERALQGIRLHSVLNLEEKRLLRVGLCKLEDKERFSPLHPLVLAYYSQLVAAIRSDRDTDGHSSFDELPEITRERMVASGLMPFAYDEAAGYAHLQPVKENNGWLELVPRQLVSHSFVKRLVRDKLAEFTKAYARLFRAGPNSTLIVNAINQGEAAELFLGLVEHFKLHGDAAFAIHVNFYDARLQFNEFDRFAETPSYDALKTWLGLNNGSWREEADLLIDLLRSRLTYSKFVTPTADGAFTYAHLAFFSNNAPVECHLMDPAQALSGVLCDGLIAGEAAETKDSAYFTAFGLRHVEVEPHPSLRVARLLGQLWQPARKSNDSHLGLGIGLAVSADFKQLLTHSYNSALWTTIIDPKVTLDFFTSQKDVVLIHYSDQYTSAAGYDAITVTRRVDLFEGLLRKESQTLGRNLLSEFNAFNGEWLLQMLTANATQRKEKNGIIGAYKFVSGLLLESDISWVPLSVAEMIRVSGNVGLKMSDSEFSRHVHGYRKGAISDDVLFVGFKDDTLYLLPLEVKTGARPDFKHAGEQAQELLRYLRDEVLGPQRLANRLYRGLFVRQVLQQVEKLRLYGVLSAERLSELLARREWWLKGEYQVSAVPGYVDGIVLAHIDNDSCFEPQLQTTAQNLLQIELPYALLPQLMSAEGDAELAQFVAWCKGAAHYRLQPLQPAVSASIEVTGSAGAATTTTTTAASPVPLAAESPAVYAPSEATDESALPVVTSEPTATSEPAGPLQVLFGHDALRQRPLYWEPTNTAKFMNTNTGIIGTMGTGKTQFTKSLITQLMRQQGNNVNGAPIGMLIFDYKSDYVDDAFTDANQSKKFKLHRLPYNPLSLYGDMPMLPVHTATGFAETLTKAFGLGPKQQLKLRKLILDAYELAGISKSDASTWSRPAPTLTQVWDLFLEQEKVEEDSLYAALDSLVTYEIFETQPDAVCSLYDLLDGVTVIELAGYSPQIQNLVVALTLDLFYSQMQKRGKPQVQGDYRQITKMILVDEADNFMSQDFPSLRKILKEGREYGVGVILSTQDLSHFKTGENNYGSYILTWVVHRVAEIKNADIKAIFNKDDKSEQDQLMETIRKLDKHFSLYIDGEKQVSKMRDRAFWEIN